MARKQVQGQDDSDDEINMTPMLDIVFIMLIFFIVTSSFIRETGIDPFAARRRNRRRAGQG